MTNKPTPAQARALQSLSSEYSHSWNQPYLDLWIGENGEIRSVRNNNINPKIRISTARILLSDLWIEKAIDQHFTPRKYVISNAGRGVLATLTSADFISPKQTINTLWNTADIRDALIEKYRKLNEKGYESAAVWIYFCELGNHRFASRRVDFWCMACWRSLDYKRISYEIKVSRADFLKELRDPTKREFALSVSHEFYFVSPPGIIKVSELPDEAGLIELNDKGNLVTKKKAPTRVSLFEFDWSFAATLGRNIFRAWRDEKLP